MPSIAPPLPWKPAELEGLFRQVASFFYYYTLPGEDHANPQYWPMLSNRVNLQEQWHDFEDMGSNLESEIFESSLAWTLLYEAGAENVPHPGEYYCYGHI